MLTRNFFSSRMDLTTTIKIQHIPESLTDRVCQSQTLSEDNESVIVNQIKTVCPTVGNIFYYIHSNRFHGPFTYD